MTVKYKTHIKDRCVVFLVSYLNLGDVKKVEDFLLVSSISDSRAMRSLTDLTDVRAMEDSLDVAPLVVECVGRGTESRGSLSDCRAVQP